MNILELFTPIRAFAFDVDGVLTNGQLLLTEDNQMLRSMNIKDGYAMEQAIKKGYKIWTISGSTSAPAKARFNRLGITDAYDGVKDKKEFLQQLATKQNIPYKQILYMGDDVPDHAVMKICGLPCCPNDAIAEIKQISKYISPYKGGEGCVRDVIEKVLKLNGDWES